MSEQVQSAEAADLANTLVLDLLVGIRSLDFFNALGNRCPVSPEIQIGFGRLSTIHLILALSKWQEFYDRYKAVIPKHLSPAAKEAHRELKSRGVREFRNKVAGHIWDNELGRPLLAEEVKERLEQIIQSDEEAFHRWIHNPEAKERSSHLVGLTEEIRDALLQQPLTKPLHRTAKAAGERQQR